MQSKKRIVIILTIIIAILIVIATGLLVYKNLLTGSNTSTNDIKQSVSSTQKIVEDFYDKPITDEKIALEAIELNRNQLGYGDINFSFEFEGKEEWMGASYSFKLLYKNIPVSDRGISVITKSDYSGNKLITGGVDIEKISKINITPKITQDEATNIAKETLGEEFKECYEFLDKKVYIRPKLVIYETKNQYVLAYIYSGIYTICIVDAQNGNIITSHSRFCTGVAEYEGQNGDIQQIFYDSKEDIKDLLWNKDKNIFIMDDYTGEFMSINDIQMGKNKSAVDAMANTYRAVEFFEKYFSKTFDVKVVTINCTDEKTIDNASGGSEKDEEGTFAYIYFGERKNKKKLQFSAYLDIVAHEYTHAVTSSIAFDTNYRRDDSKYFEQNALKEAYSDIFGELVEREYTGDNDWKVISRNLKEPKIREYSKRYIGEKDNGGAHDNSTIISHTAYLMSRDNYNKKYDAEFLLDYNQLGQLWYRSLEYLKDMEFKNFSDCRWAIELSAEELINEGVLLEGNLKVIEQAFNEVGVDRDVVRHSVEKGLKIISTTKNSTLVVSVETETTPSEIVEVLEVTTTKLKSELPEIVQAVLDNEETWLNELNEMTYGYDGATPKVGYNECWFQDIDMDGTPEFIVGGMGFQSDGIVIQVYNIYKYKNGSLQRIEINGRTFSGEKEPYLEVLWDGEEPHYGSGAFNNLLKVFKNNNTGKFLYTMEHKYDYTSDPDGGGVISFYVYNMNKDVLECDGNHIVYCSVDKNNIINGNYRVYNHDGEVDEQEFLKTYNSFFENLTPYKTTIKSIPCTKLSDGKSGYYDTMSLEQKKQALLSSYNAWSCKENSNAELPLSKFVNELSKRINEPKKSLSEDELRNIISSYGNVCAWEYADYDGDGTKEAFAIIGENSSPDYYVSDKIQSVYFINSQGNVKEVRNSFDGFMCNAEAYTTYSGKGFFSCNVTAGGSSWKTYLFSVKNGECYELNISGAIQDFYIKNNKCYTTESEFLSEGGHVWSEIELVYDENSQEFSKGSHTGNYF